MSYKPRGYWDIENCREEASKYTSRSQFKSNCSPAYSKARKNRWLDDICSHMILLQKPNGYWNIERCREESLKYNTRVSFGNNCSGAYGSASRNGWLDDLCSHMNPQKKQNGFWTKEQCREEALKYDNYKDFIENCAGAIYASRVGEWYDEITSHFNIKGSRHKRFIYAYEFPDNHVYVGLTYNIKERMLNHLVKGTVFDYKESSKLEPKFIQLTDIPVEVETAKKLEGVYLNNYIDNGWIKLNKRATGAVGANYMKWNYDNCKKEALKYITINDFRLSNPSAYNSVKRNNWDKDIFSHMKVTKKPSGYYTLEKCIEIGKDCKSISDMSKRYSTACRKIYQNGWAEVVKAHFKTEE